MITTVAWGWGGISRIAFPRESRQFWDTVGKGDSSVSPLIGCMHRVGDLGGQKSFGLDLV